MLVAVALLGAQVGAAALPDPTGPLSTRVVEYHWTDSTRTDPILQPARPREITARIWLPERPAGPASPVIVFATGRAVSGASYSALAGDLASHGFAVAVIESPHQSITRLADGTSVPPAASWTPTRAMLEQFTRADSALEQMNATVAGDLRFAVRMLDAANRQPGGSLAGALDLDRLGMAGHSNGAMAGSRACATEPRCRAFLGIEGTQAREVRTGSNDKPFGLIISEASLGYDRENVYRALAAQARAPFVVFRVNGAGHNSATDIMFTRPGLFTYQLSAERGLAIERTLAGAFFARFLEQRHVTAAFPEVTIEAHPSPR